MPRKTKEQIKETTPEKETKKVKTTSKENSSKAKITKTSKTTSSTKKATKTRATSTAKKTTANAKKTATKKTTSAKKASATKKPVKASITKKTTTKKVAIPIVEYYDLPYRYNQTIVKILAQTPTTLFVYWDISDEDRENYKETYGENFFEETKPVLIIHNTTLNYSFEVEINDFANSWYLHVNDSKCNYNIELGRRPVSNKIKENINTDYIYVSSSNVIESPNDKILFNTDEHKVYFRNVKTNITSTRSISFIRSMGKIYNIYDIYKTVYKNENLEEFIGLSSSNFK